MKQMFLKQYSVSILLFPMVIYLLGFFAPISSKLHNNIFYIIVLVPFILWVKKRELLDLFQSRIVLFTVVFTGYLAVRSLFYLPFDFSEVKDPFRHLVSFWVFFAVGVSLFREEFFRTKINSIALWAAVWGTGAAVLYYSQHRFPGRLQYNGPTDHAIIGACVYAVISLFVLFHNRRFPLFLSIITFISLFSSVLFSQSRGPLLALTVAVVAGSMCRCRKWVVAIPIAFWAFFIVAQQQGWVTFGRLFKATSSYRFQIWQQVINNSWTGGDWIFGQSLLADQTVTVGKHTFQHAHSGYISTFFHGGVIGFILLVALMIVVGWFVIKVWQRDRCSLTVALYIFSGLIIATDTHKMLDGPGALWFYFWLPLAYIAAQELKMSQCRVDDNTLEQPD